MFLVLPEQIPQHALYHALITRALDFAIFTTVTLQCDIVFVEVAKTISLLTINAFVLFKSE